MKPKQGRPKINPAHLRVGLSARVDPKTMREIKRVSKMWDQSIGEVIDDLVRLLINE